MQGVLNDYKEQLEGDPIVNRHLSDLFKALLEQNLIRVITPYSKVQIKHLAKLISLDPTTVEREVSQMILDKKISGVPRTCHGFRDTTSSTPFMLHKYLFAHCFKA